MLSEVSAERSRCTSWKTPEKKKAIKLAIALGTPALMAGLKAKPWHDECIYQV